MPNRIARLTVRVATIDGEFPLALAVYVRDELGIRSAACFLLALAGTRALASSFAHRSIAVLVCARSVASAVRTTLSALLWRRRSSAVRLVSARIFSFGNFLIFSFGCSHRQQA